jgi:hypothetical protein
MLAAVLPLVRFLAPVGLALAVLAPAAAQTIAPVRPTPGAALGINLSSWASYHQEWAFVDVMKGAADWVSQRVVGGSWNTGEPIALRSDGYPAYLNTDQAVATVMLKETGDRYPGGRYVILWDGDGDLQLRDDAVLVSRNGNRIEADVRPRYGIQLRIIRTNPSDPVRNIRVLMPGHEATHQTRPFHPRFLATWRGFKVLRFMNWMRTGNTQSRWSERTTPRHFSQATDRGVAVEHMLQLANELDADPWFCLPHLADDDYARQLGRTVAAGLERGRRVYLEFSNECWNNSFEQARWCRSEGTRLGLSSDPFEAQLRFYSQRAVELFRIARQELAPTHQVVRVLCSQNVNSWVGETMLDWRNAWQEVEALGVAPYFGYDLGHPSRQAEVSQWSVERVLGECWNDLGPTLQGTAANVAAARRRGLVVVGYEAGQHLVGFGGAENNTALTSLFIAANRHAGMYFLYAALLEGWSATGAGTLLPYNSMGKPSKWGSWGALEFAEQDPFTAPKYLAMRLWLDRNR